MSEALAPANSPIPVFYRQISRGLLLPSWLESHGYKLSDFWVQPSLARFMCLHGSKHDCGALVLSVAPNQGSSIRPGGFWCPEHGMVYWLGEVDE